MTFSYFSSNSKRSLQRERGLENWIRSMPEFKTNWRFASTHHPSSCQTWLTSPASTITTLKIKARSACRLLRYDQLKLLFFKKNGPFPASFYLFSSFHYTVDSKQMSNNFLPMTGFKPRTSGIGSNRSTNWATQPMPWATQPLPKNLHFRQGFRFRLSPLASNLQVLSRYHCIDNLAAKYANI